MDNIEILKKEIGKRLKYIRNTKDMTQAQFSEKIGLEAKSYANIETGLRLFSVEVLLKIITELDVSADFILTGRINYHTPVTDAIKSLDAKNTERMNAIIQIFSEAVSEKR